MPYIWIPRYDRRKLKEIEKTVEHIIESSTKNLQPIKTTLPSAGYMSATELEGMVQRAQKDEMGRVRLDEVPYKREKFTVVGMEPTKDGVKVKKRKI